MEINSIRNIYSAFLKKFSKKTKVQNRLGDYPWCRRQGGQRQGNRNPSQKLRTGFQGRSL